MWLGPQLAVVQNYHSYGDGLRDDLQRTIILAVRPTAHFLRTFFVAAGSTADLQSLSIAAAGLPVDLQSFCFSRTGSTIGLQSLSVIVAGATAALQSSTYGVAGSLIVLLSSSLAMAVSWVILLSFPDSGPPIKNVCLPQMCLGHHCDWFFFFFLFHFFSPRVPCLSFVFDFLMFSPCLCVFFSSPVLSLFLAVHPCFVISTPLHVSSSLSIVWGGSLRVGFVRIV